MTQQSSQHACRTREECGVHANAEGTDEDLPIEQSDQDPHQWRQKGPLNHGGKKVPAAKQEGSSDPNYCHFGQY